MRCLALPALLLALLIPLSASAQQQERPAELKTSQDQASYAIGVNIARQLQANGLEVNPEALIRGIRDLLTGAKLSLSDEQAQAALVEFHAATQARLEQKRKEVGAKNKSEGDLFLTENKKQEGVVELPSGLQYKVLKEGTGELPGANDTVRTHYHGTLINGTVFDSSVERGEPATFPVGSVIRGWTEALQKMKVGSKWRLYVPPELAYGSDGIEGSEIGPNSVLIFDVELLGIE
jgi:FKBP-type peptidyl-prolyl cis-trans isomerase FklB